MQLRLGPLPIVTFFSLISFVRAANFTFQYGDTTSCGAFNVSWSGGTPPFQLTLIPVFQPIMFFKIPDANFSNGLGSFLIPLPFAADQKFVATMSDAAGFGSGGTSDVLTVGAAVGGDTCNTTGIATDFTFELNSALNQCTPYTFSAYDDAVQPITITGVIPGGRAFLLTPPKGPATFDWIADVAAGTSILWIVTDSQGRSGGSSDLKLVGASNDNSCLSGNSPASLSVFPSHTSPTSPSETPSGSSSPSPTSASSKGPNTGLIAGVSIAGVFGVIAIVLLVLFIMRKKSHHARRFRHEVDLMEALPEHLDDHTAPPVNPFPYTMSTHGSSQPGSFYGGPTRSQSSHNLLSEPSDYELDASPFSNPYPVRGGSSVSGSSAPQSYGGEGSLTLAGSSRPYPPSSSSSSSTGRSKAALAGVQPYKPQRFVVHTDLVEAPPVEEEEVIELPPQYSESRAPIPGLHVPAAIPSIEFTPATPSSPRRNVILQ